MNQRSLAGVLLHPATEKDGENMVDNGDAQSSDLLIGNMSKIFSRPRMLKRFARPARVWLNKVYLFHLVLNGPKDVSVCWFRGRIKLVPIQPIQFFVLTGLGQTAGPSTQTFTTSTTNCFYMATRDPKEKFKSSRCDFDVHWKLDLVTSDDWFKHLTDLY